MYVPPQALSSTRDSCEEGDCHLDLAGVANTVNVICLDSLKKVLKRPGRISDCAILWKNRDIFAIVELKGGQANVNADLVVKQIQQGLDTMDSLMSDQHIADFFPIILYRSKDPTTSLRGRQVRFRGIDRKIILGQCGNRLNKMLRPSWLRQPRLT